MHQWAVLLLFAAAVDNFPKTMWLHNLTPQSVDCFGRYPCISVIDGAAIWAQWAGRCRRCRPSYKRRRKQKGTASMKKTERHWPSSSSDFSPNPSPVLAVPHSNLSDSSSKLYPEFLSVLTIVIWRSRTITGNSVEAGPRQLGPCLLNTKGFNFTRRLSRYSEVPVTFIPLVVYEHFN